MCIRDSGQLAYPGPAGHREQRHVVLLPAPLRAHIVGEAESLTRGLTREAEARDLAAALEQDQVVVRRGGLVEAVEAAGADDPLLDGHPLEVLHHLVDLQHLRIALLQQARHRALHPEVLAQELSLIHISEPTRLLSISY